MSMIYDAISQYNTMYGPALVLTACAHSIAIMPIRYC